jgi:hypothetical protein
MSYYVHIITVTIIYPKGWEPAGKEIRRAVISKERGYKRKVEADSLALVKKIVKENIDAADEISFRVKSVTTMVHGVFLTDDCYENNKEHGHDT